MCIRDSPKIDKLKLPVGFQAEHLYSPAEHDQGSWVAMTFDNKGRMITSDQYGSLYRLNVPKLGDTTMPKVESLIIGKEAYKNPDTSTLMIGMGFAQGLLYAFNSLYAVSYTHLDVYKRQILYSFFFSFFSFGVSIFFFLSASLSIL